MPLSAHQGGGGLTSAHYSTPADHPFSVSHKACVYVCLCMTGWMAGRLSGLCLEYWYWSNLSTSLSPNSPPLVSVLLSLSLSLSSPHLYTPSYTFPTARSCLQHQQQVLAAIERAKQVTPPEMNSIIRVRWSSPPPRLWAWWLLGNCNYVPLSSTLLFSLMTLIYWFIVCEM